MHEGIFATNFRHFYYVKFIKTGAIISKKRKGLFVVRQSGQLVTYGIHGVCNILGTETKTIDRKKIEYYVLEPVDQPGSKFSIPAHNEIAVNKLHPLLTKEELDSLLRDCSAQNEVWISDENQRKQLYRELINSGDHVALLKMVRALFRHKKDQLASGRKFHLCDENFMKDAIKLLDSEFSMVLGIKQQDVGAYIKSYLDKE